MLWSVVRGLWSSYGIDSARESPGQRTKNTGGAGAGGGRQVVDAALEGPQGEEGECHRFLGLGRNTIAFDGADRCWRRQLCEVAHERSVAHAAAADHDVAHVMRDELPIALDNRKRGEVRQRRQHIM